MESQMDNSFIVMSFYNFDICLKKEINGCKNNSCISNTLSDNDFTNIYYLPDDYQIPNLIKTGSKIPAIDYSLTGTGDINAIIGLLDLIYQEKLVNIEQIEISKNQTIDLSLWEIKLLLKIIHF